jgi:hypothetical protein
MCVPQLRFSHLTEALRVLLWFVYEALCRACTAFKPSLISPMASAKGELREMAASMNDIPA